MKLTFLGTGTSQGIPVIGSTHPVCLSNDDKDKRLRSSVLIEVDNQVFVIDCGPDFRQQMLRAGVTKLDALIFTHEHADHTAGMDDIRPFFFKQGDIPFYAHKRVFGEFEKRFDYIFSQENRYPSAPSVAVNTIENKVFKINETEILPINLMHGTLQVFGFRIHDLAYLTDIKTIAEAEIEKLKNLDVLIVSALRKEASLTHFTLDEALAFIEIVKPKKTYLTHISHDLGFHEVVEKTLPNNVFLAYDGLEIEVD